MDSNADSLDTAVKRPKVAICWIGIGAYNVLWKDFYATFKEMFLTDCDRTFFVFTDQPEITDGLSDCVTYTVSHACRHTGFILFRKFKYLMTAEDRYLGFDHVVFANGNCLCVNPVSFADLDPGDREISVIPHACGNTLCGRPYAGSAADVEFTDGTTYVQAGFFMAKSGFFLRVANEIESLRCADKANGKSSAVPWHDESYFNSVMFRHRDRVRILPAGLYGVPQLWRFDTARVVTRAKNGIKPRRYQDFKEDLY